MFPSLQKVLAETQKNCEEQRWRRRKRTLFFYPRAILFVSSFFPSLCHSTTTTGRGREKFPSEDDWFNCLIVLFNREKRRKASSAMLISWRVEIHFPPLNSTVFYSKRIHEMRTWFSGLLRSASTKLFLLSPSNAFSLPFFIRIFDGLYRLLS